MMPALTLAQAQDQEDDSQDDRLALFDDDVELAQGGWPRFKLTVGAVRLDGDGTYRLRGPNGNKVTLVDFERVGIRDSDSSHFLSLTWRSETSRWGAWFANWRFENGGTRAWNQDFDFGSSTVIPVGASVTTTFDADWYIAEVSYSLVRTKTVDAGIGVGVHTVNLETELVARIDVGDQSREIVQADLDTLAPLPNVLGYVYWRLAPKWSFAGRMGWFGLDYDKYDGQMVNAFGSLNYDLNERWGLALGYQLVKLDVNVEDEPFSDIYDMDFSGPMLLLRINF
jgi:hypothetical protein